MRIGALGAMGVALLGACGAEEPVCGGGECLTCSEGFELVMGRLAGGWVDPNRCVADSECVVVGEQIECGGSSFGTCGFVVHAESRHAFDEAVVDATAKTCGRIESACEVSAQCEDTMVRCAAFDCWSVRTGCLEACAALGCGDCAARCSYAPDCFDSVATCAEADDCGGPRFPIRAMRYDAAAGCLRPPVVVGILDTFELIRSGDVTCGVGPDGEAYVFTSRTDQMSVGFPDCAPEVGRHAQRADFCR
jgi:hypothetical protein